MSFFITIAIKLALGLVSLVLVINVTGKGNLAPNSATDQVQNFILGGIIGGVIYNSSITILQYAVILIIWTILILLLKWLNTNVSYIKHLIDGKPTLIIKNGQLDPEACRSKGLSASDVALKIEILETIGKTEEWLMDELKKEGFDDVSDIFIAEYDKGEINVVTY